MLASQISALGITIQQEVRISNADKFVGKKEFTCIAIDSVNWSVCHGWQKLIGTEGIKKS